MKPSWAASSTRRRRFSSESVQPAGLWKFGITWVSLAGRRRAPLERRDVYPVRLERDGIRSTRPLEHQKGPVVGGLLDHDLVARLSRWWKIIAAASIEPFVTMTRSASIPCSSAIHSQRPGCPLPLP